MTFQLINPEIKFALLAGLAAGAGAALIVHKLEGGDWIFETSLSLRGALDDEIRRYINH